MLSLLLRSFCEVVVLVTIPNLLLLVNAGRLSAGAIAFMLASALTAFFYLLYN